MKRVVYIVIAMVLMLLLLEFYVGIKVKNIEKSMYEEHYYEHSIDPNTFGK